MAYFEDSNTCSVVCVLLWKEANKLCCFKKIDIQTAVIKCFAIKDLSPTDMKQELSLNESSPLFQAVKNWANEFKHDQTYTFYDERSGCPTTATNKEPQQKSTMPYYMIDNADIGETSVDYANILHEHLGSCQHNG